jgi:hypothetical protein
VKEDSVGIDRQAKDRMRQLHKREARAIADMQNTVRRRRAQLQAVVEDKGRQGLSGAEMERANEQQSVGVGGLKQRVEVLEQDHQRLSAANEVTK